MYGAARDGEDPNVFCYLTLYNEEYDPARPVDQHQSASSVDDGIVAGLTCLRAGRGR